MKPTFLPLVAMVWIIFSNNPVRADWRWQNDMVTATVLPKWYEAKFSFENKGTGPVTVTDVTFSCGCIVYRFASTTAKAGEKGTLTVRIQRTDDEASDKDLDLIVNGPPSTKPQELTVRIEKLNSKP